MPRVLKWVGIALGGIVALAAVVFTASYFISEGTIHETYEIEEQPIALAEADSAMLARGEHLSWILGCHECHGEQLSGRIVVDAPPFRAVAPNLTSAESGIGGAYTTADWVRAIRHGIGADGEPLVIMPSAEYNRIGMADLAALVAYLEQVPPVESELPATEIRLPGRLILTLGGAEGLYAATRIDHSRPIPTAPEQAPTAEYGAYLYRAICFECHGAAMEGGPHPDPSLPLVPSLGPASAWSTEQFAQALRQGVTPTGRGLDPRAMPWQAFRHMTDLEVEALHAYIRETIAGMAGE